MGLDYTGHQLGGFTGLQLLQDVTLGGRTGVKIPSVPSVITPISGYLVDRAGNPIVDRSTNNLVTR